MRYKRLLQNLLALTLLVLFGYLNEAGPNSALVGSLFFIFYLFFVSNGIEAILVNFFAFNSVAIRTRIISIFLSLVIVGWAVGAVIVFYHFNTAVVALTLFIVGWVSVFLKQWAEKNNAVVRVAPIDDEISASQNPGNAKVKVVAYMLIYFYSFFLLYSNRSNDVLQSPWQAINANYIYFFFAATLILGWLIYSSLRIKYLLIFLVLHSILLHSYLPLSHKLLYGADQWRHLAVESSIIAGESLKIKSFDNAPVSLLQSLNPGRFAYSQLLATESLVAIFTNIDLLVVNKWLVLIIWSIIFPLLAFELAYFFVRDKRKSTFFVWICFLPFALQVMGSQTLPNNYGFLVWIALLLLLLKRLRQPKKEQIILLCFIAVASLFGYSLYLILYLLTWIAVEIIKIESIKISSAASGVSLRLNNIQYLISFALFTFAIPIVEIISRYSNFDPKINVIYRIKQFVGNIIGYYFVTGPRSHDISGGNIIFNQSPIYSFVENFFTRDILWIMFVAIVLIIFAIIGLIVLTRQDNKERRFFVCLAVGLWLSYVLSFYMLAGDKIISRRLDGVLALIISLLLFSGIDHFIKSAKNHQPFLKTTTVLLLTAVITVSYSLGPDTKTVSVNEYQAMQYIWSQENKKTNHCVIAETYPLLALEYLSQKKIIGGGFPIDKNFAQPEREQLVASTINTNAISSARQLTSSDYCWVVQKINVNSDINGKKFGNVSVVKVQ